MFWGFPGLTPLIQHSGRYSVQLGHFLFVAAIGDQFEPVAVGVAKVYGLEDPMIGWPNDVETFGFDDCFGRQQGVQGFKLERNVLYPVRRIIIESHRWRIG